MSKGMIVFGVASMILFANAPVNAEEVVAKKPVDVPTLDWLHGQDEKYPQSVYTITPSDESDYDFVYKDAISGQETYYKIVLKNFSSDSVIWTNVTSEIKDNTIPDDRSIVAVKLPSGTQYLEYKLQEGATLQLHKSDLRSVAVDGIVSGAFIELNGSEDGGAIHNEDKDNSAVDIKADFVKNHSSHSGGAIYNSKMNAKIGDIKGNFIGNYVKSESGDAKGGAINNESATIGNITGDFIGNYAQGHSYANGGAIYNSKMNAKIGNITGDFIGNYASSSNSYVYGGAIYNYGTIGDITGDFSDNYASSSNSSAKGGAIYNSKANIGNITGDFSGNYAQGHYYADGGAIYNSGTNAKIGDITGDFIGNYAKSENSSAHGGAIYNYGTIGDITGDFTGNYASSSNSSANGGAIYNGYNGTIGDIIGDFTGNYAQGHSYAYGGAIFNYKSAEIGNITGDFSGNYAQGNYAYGGAIYNERGTIGDITGDFRGNYAQGNYAYGGAIFNYKSKMNSIINSNFIDNYVSGNEESKGGAIYSGGSDLQITADGKTSLFSGNKVNDKSNAIYMESVVEENYSNRTYTVPAVNLNLTAVNNGVITFDDGIDGGFVISDKYKDYTLEGEIETYNINIDSDGTGVVQFNNLVENVTNFNVSADAKVHLGVNADIQTKNMNVLGSMSRMARSEFSPLITVDVSVNKAENRVDSGKIHVDGDIVGNYRILVNALNADVLDNLNDAIVPFLIAENDNKNTESSFIIAHVLGTPYMWDGGINVKGEEQGSTWYLNLTEEVNPDYVPPVEEPDEGDDNKDDDKPNTGDDNNGDDDKPATGDDDKPTKPAKPVENKPVYAEVMAGVGLHEAALEQTRSVTRHVSDQVACPRRYCSECGGDEHKFTDLCQRSWVIVQGENATMNSPVKADAKIWGMEAGFDVQRDDHNKLGVFVSYRKGDYDLSGQGKRLHSKDGSEIDITSYLAGLYYRYAKNQDWLFATIYGGKQDAEVTTHDGLGVFDTDGVELGASVEAGRTYALTDTWSLTPSVGFKYTQIDFDGANDNVSKTYKWDTVKQLEAEAGAKLEKQVENSRFYIKPSVIRTFTSGDSVNITGLRDVDTYHDQTLGRLEVGADVELTEKLAVTGWVNHTVGSDYHATAYGIGLKYTW